MLEGDRIIIKPPLLEHAPLIYEAILESKYDLAKFLPWVHYVKSIKDSVQSTKNAIDNYEAFNDELRFSIFCNRTQMFLGIISLTFINKSIAFFEIGYWLRTSQTGKGYMIEAVKLIEKYAFSELNAKRLEIRVAEQNIKSRKTIKHCSFIYEGKLMNASYLPNDEVDNALVFGKVSL